MWTHYIKHHLPVPLPPNYCFYPRHYRHQQGYIFLLSLLGIMLQLMFINYLLFTGCCSACNDMLLMSYCALQTLRLLLMQLFIWLIFVVAHCWWISVMLFKWECWCAVPQLVNVSSFKDGVDGAVLNEHHQPFFVYRELQPSICAVSQLECWLHAYSQARVSSEGTPACCHVVAMLAVLLWYRAHL